MAVLSVAVCVLLFFCLLYVLPKQDPDDDFEDSKAVLKIVGTIVVLMGAGTLIGISPQSTLVILGCLFLLGTSFVLTLNWYSR